MLSSLIVPANNELIVELAVEVESKVTVSVAPGTPFGFQLLASDQLTVLAPLSQGNTVAYFTERKNVADSNFILAKNPEQRLKDIKLAYTTISESKALEIFHKYNVKYLFISREAQKTYGVKRPIYLENENCFKQAKSTVYEIKC